MYIIHALHEYIYVFMQDMCVYRLMYTLYMQIYTSIGPIECALYQAELIRLPGLSYVGFAELRFSMEGIEWRCGRHILFTGMLALGIFCSPCHVESITHFSGCLSVAGSFTINSDAIEVLMLGLVWWLFAS